MGQDENNMNGTRWKCKQDGNANKMEMQTRWKCKQDGNANKMEMQTRWTSP